MNWPLNGTEDGGLGALIMALVWAFVTWWRKRQGSDASVARKN